MKKIVFDLHGEENYCVLKSQDVYKYVGESNEKDVELALYTNKWCEYLNYHVFNSKEMLFGDPKFAELEGWISGYNFAKKIEVEHSPSQVVIKTKEYLIILPRPFEI